MAFVDDAAYHVSYASGELTHDIFKNFLNKIFHHYKSYSVYLGTVVLRKSPTIYLFNWGSSKGYTLLIKFC